jgi:hypothetical protein
MLGCRHGVNPKSSFLIGARFDELLPQRPNAIVISGVQRHHRPPVGNRSPPKRLAKASASSGLATQNTTKSLSSHRREYASGVADKAPAAQNIASLFNEAPHLLGRNRHVMRPSALEIGACDFACVGHRRPVARGSSKWDGKASLSEAECNQASLTLTQLSISIKC